MRRSSSTSTREHSAESERGARRRDLSRVEVFDRHQFDPIDLRNAMARSPSFGVCDRVLSAGADACDGSLEETARFSGRPDSEIFCFLEKRKTARAMALPGRFLRSCLSRLLSKTSVLVPRRAAYFRRPPWLTWAIWPRDPPRPPWRACP